MSKNQNKFLFRMSIIAFFIANLISLYFFILTSNGFYFGFDVFRIIIFYFSFLTPAIIVFVSYFYKSRVENNNEWLIFSPVLAITYSSIIGLGCYLAAIIIGNAFKGILIDYAAGSVLIGLYTAAVTYYLANQILKFDYKKLLRLLTVFFSSGLLLAATLNQDHNWWGGSICSLGMAVNGNPIIYNGTLLITGLLMILLAKYINRIFRIFIKNEIITNIQNKILSICYLISLVMMFMVALLPYGQSPIQNQFHIYGSYLIFIIFAFLLLGMKFILPNFPNNFHLLNYLILIVLLLFVLIFVWTNYFTVSIMEIDAIILIGVWFKLFSKNIDFVLKKVSR